MHAKISSYQPSFQADDMVVSFGGKLFKEIAMQDYLTTGQLAAKCETTGKRIADLAYAGVITDFVMVGNRRMFHVRCVDGVKGLLAKLDQKRAATAPRQSIEMCPAVAGAM